MLANTMIHLVEIDPETELRAEPYIYEYGCYMFEELPSLVTTMSKVHEIMEGGNSKPTCGKPRPNPDQMIIIDKMEELKQQQ